MPDRRHRLFRRHAAADQAEPDGLADIVNAELLGGQALEDDAERGSALDLKVEQQPGFRQAEGILAVCPDDRPSPLCHLSACPLLNRSGQRQLRIICLVLTVLRWLPVFSLTSRPFHGPSACLRWAYAEVA